MPSLIGTLVDITLIVDPLKNSLNSLVVSVISGTHEIVIFDIHFVPQMLKAGYDFVHIGLRVILAAAASGSSDHVRLIP